MIATATQTPDSNVELRLTPKETGVTLVYVLPYSEALSLMLDLQDIAFRVEPAAD